MSRGNKSKGIVIELTALLDVILIMLFWVMMSVRDGSQADAEAAREEAKTANRLVAELNKKLEQKDEEVKELRTFIDNFDADSVELQNALEGYESGMLITLYIKYEDTGRLVIRNSEKTLGETNISSSAELSASMISAFENAGLEQDDVILCTLVYDGNSALYRDVKTVGQAVEGVREAYKSFYCADINMAEKTGE